MMKIPFSPPDISKEELEIITDVLKSGWITTGPKTKQFEKELAEYSNTNKFVALNSATACMEMTLRVLGIGKGDEVILPAYTYTATASVICHVGATPVMVDISSDGIEMDYEKMSEAITERTKVIMPVDLGGVICNYDKIYEVIEANKHKFKPNNEIQKNFNRIIVLSDSAHSFGSIKNGKRCGNFSDFSTFSFHAVKNLTTAEGGAVTWQSKDFIDDEKLYKDFMNISLHGQTKDALSKTKLGSWEYDIVEPAYKCNMTDISAAIGLGQLHRYDDMLLRRKEIVEFYENILKEYKVTTLKHFDENLSSSSHLYLMRIEGIDVEERNELIERFAEQGVATNVHYKPLPMLTAYKNLGFDIKDYPNAYNYYKNEISLPLYSKLTNEELEYIGSVINVVLEKYKK